MCVTMQKLEIIYSIMIKLKSAFSQEFKGATEEPR